MRYRAAVLFVTSLPPRRGLCIILACLLGTAGIASCARSRPHPAARHVVLISIDTCRADHLGCYGAQRPATPNIDGVARQATLFRHVLSPVPLTLPAHCSMLTGTIPLDHGVTTTSMDGLRPVI